MKKTYIQPAIEADILYLESLLADSPLSFNNDNEGETGLNDTGATGEALSRRYNVWDDDWSE
jgi:hypothetical protein